jgi:transcriptional regulator with XRE-family HTH domain
VESIDQADTLDRRIAERLRSLRAERGWSLDELAQRSAVSRATLSRLENGEVSPTANVLGKLTAAYGLTMSRLMLMMEDDFTPLMRPEMQPVWRDPELGFERRSLSPPAQTLAGEVVSCTLKPGAYISYDRPSRPGLEHHIYLVSGALRITVDGKTHDLKPGDCLRYRLFGASAFATPDHSPAQYYLFLV